MSLAAARPRWSEEERGPRLHLPVSPSCSCRCLFCMEEPAARRRQPWVRDARELLRRVAAWPRRDRLVFSGGEPTLNRELVPMVAAARRLGFVRIGVTTNGRRLADAAYLERLLAAGATDLIFSIHGVEARTEDALLRAPGAHAEKRQALCNLVAARAAGRRFHLQTSTVLTRRNLPELAALLLLLQKHGAGEAVLNVMKADLGPGRRHARRLLPRLTEVAAAVARLPGELQVGLRVVGLPPCLARDLPPEVRGWHEVRLVPDAGAGFAAPAEGATFGPRCGACAARPLCPGVTALHAEIHGWEGFVPVTPGARP